MILIIDRPVVIKGFSNTSNQIKDLYFICDRLTNIEKRKLVLNEIASRQAGLKGEEIVFYTLANSDLPMYILHDISIQEFDYTYQFDIIAVTPKFLLMIEVKHLNGDLDITQDGNIEYYNYNKKYCNKDVITQAKLHIDTLKSVVKEQKELDNFEVYYLVVLSNDNRVYDKSRRDLLEFGICKNNVLIQTIADMLKYEKQERNISEESMQRITNILINENKPSHYNNSIPGYQFSDEDFEEKDIETTLPLYKCHELREILLGLRWRIAKENNTHEYYIYTNRELDRLVALCPRTLGELKQIPGFMQHKINKYGAQIVNTINKFLRGSSKW